MTTKSNQVLVALEEGTKVIQRCANGWKTGEIHRVDEDGTGYILWSVYEDPYTSNNDPAHSLRNLLYEEFNSQMQSKHQGGLTILVAGEGHGGDPMEDPF